MNLAGKYRLIAQLGQGGMATVYLAVAVGTSGFRRLAVVKQLRHDLAIDPNLVQMFLDEALLCARLNHRNIVHIYDVGLDEHGHLIAMEYLDGVSLHAGISRLRSKGNPLTFPERARILVDVLEGLRYAHELKDFDGSLLNIVHRDVSPPNIILTCDGTVKLLDFGIAKAAISSTHTEAGVIKGKLGYMAPEQARGERVDARADLYAVGVMLWEAVTGRRRWPAEMTQAAMLLQLARDDPPESPNAASFGYPDEVDSIVLKALAPRPEDRFQTAGEFLDVLEGVLRQLEPVSLRTVGGRFAEAFADERARMQSLIEGQFRMLETDDPASGPRSVPTFSAPGTFTGSEPVSRDMLRDPSVTRTAAAAPPSERDEPRSPAWPTKGVLLAGSLFFAALFVLLAVLFGRTPAPEEHPAAFGAPSAGLVRASTPPQVVETVREAGSPASALEGSAQAVAVDGSAKPITSEGPARPITDKGSGQGRSRVGAAVERLPQSHAVPVAKTVAPPASSSVPAQERPLLEPGLSRTHSKPRVELERENPWP